MKRVVISTSSFGKISRHPLDLLADAGCEVILNPHGRKLTPAESRELLADADGLIAGTERLDREILAAAPRLRIISRVGTGLDSVDLDAAEELGIKVLNTPDAHVPAVAELTLAGMLAVLRQIAFADRRVRAGQWTKPMGRLLFGKRVGIVGMGRVGRYLRGLLQPFMVELLAHDLEPDPSLEDVRWVGLAELLERSEVVTLHVSGGRLLDADAIASMLPGAVLVNVARGGVVDEAALAEALSSGHLAGAHLDVFEDEPYEGPLTDLDNVLLTSHIGSYAAECRVAMELEATEKVIAHFAAGGAG
ncbi:MAG: phosphoglycerate dehydrogenase [Acidobacteriota bacterium]